MDPTDAAHVLQTPEEYADFLGGLSFDKRIEMINSFRCAELQGAEELRVLSETVDDPDLAKKFARHAADEEKHGAYFGEIMRAPGRRALRPAGRARPHHDRRPADRRHAQRHRGDPPQARRDRRARPGDPDPHAVPGRREPRAGVVRGPPAHLRAGRPGHRRADRRDHRRREPPRTLRPQCCSTAGPQEGWADAVREAQEATDAREARRPRVGRRAPRGRAAPRGGEAVGDLTSERRERVLAALVQAGSGGVSGEALAADLGCSRAAVHRHVEALRREGLGVAGGPDGYRLDPGADPVVPILVAPRLSPPLAGPVMWLAETGSTNDEAIERARGGAAEGLVVGADRQSAGRGRRGRPWLAAAGHAPAGLGAAPPRGAAGGRRACCRSSRRSGRPRPWGPRRGSSGPTTS